MNIMQDLLTVGNGIDLVNTWKKNLYFHYTPRGMHLALIFSKEGFPNPLALVLWEEGKSRLHFRTAGPVLNLQFEPCPELPCVVQDLMKTQLWLGELRMIFIKLDIGK